MIPDPEAMIDSMQSLSIHRERERERERERSIDDYSNIMFVIGQVYTLSMKQ